MERGIRVPLEVIYARVIVDGRSRFLAAKAVRLSRVPVVVALIGSDHPTIYMLRAATRRRHLTDDRWACLAREEMETLSKLAKQERARHSGKRGGKGRPKSENSTKITAASKLSRRHSSRSEVANTFYVSERRIRAAQRLQDLSPKLYDQVKSGTERLSVAKRAAERNVRRRNSKNRLVLLFGQRTLGCRQHA
jgi:hypothetical protein